MDHQKIFSVVDKAIDDQPSRPSNLYIKASLLHDTHEYDKAISYVRQAIAMEPSTPAYHYLQAKLFAITKQHDKAIKSGLQADKLGMADPELDFIIADQYLAIGKYGEALDYLNNAIAKEPDNHENYYRKGEAYLNAGDTLLGEKAILKSLDIRPGFGEGLYALAALRLEAGKTSEAKGYLAKAMATNPTKSAYINKRAEILVAEGRADSAKLVLVNIARQGNGDYYSYYILSTAYLALGQYDSAHYWANATVAKNKDYVMGKIMVARSQDKLGQYDLAIEAYQDVINKDPNNNLATMELEKLKRKVAYLWQLKKQQEEAQSMPVPEPKMIRQIPDEPNN